MGVEAEITEKDVGVLAMEGLNGKSWLVVGLLTAAAIGVFIARHKIEPPAQAQAMPASVSDGRIIVVPIQTRRDGYGIAMVDTVAERLWVYEINGRSAAGSRLRLLAARSWKYDKLLDEYNTAEPRPHQVKELLDKLTQEQESRREEKLKALFEIETPGQERLK